MQNRTRGKSGDNNHKYSVLHCKFTGEAHDPNNRTQMKTAEFIFSGACAKACSCGEIIIFNVIEMARLHFHVTLSRLRANTKYFFFFRFLLNNSLTPSVRPFGFTDWIRFMHKAPTHASGLLMTGPYADTLTAMSNYFKYTGEGQSCADLWEGER